MFKKKFRREKATIILIVLALLLGGIFIFKILSKDKITSSQTTYSANQQPTFTLDISSGKISDNFQVREASAATDEQKVNEWSEGNLKIKIELEGSQKEKKPDIAISRESNTKFKLTALTNNGGFTPGKYKIKATIQENNNTREISQDFTWGVLAINTNKSIYVSGETANLAMAVLDDKGEMVCDTQMELQITNPLGKTVTLSTDQKQIVINSDCKLKEAAARPDYETSYLTSLEGKYQILLKAKTNNGNYQISDMFEVNKQLDYEVERVAPTRVYPPKTYTNSINIKFNKDFSGTIEETVPKDFDIKPITDNNYSFDGKIGAEIRDNKNGYKSIIWNVKANKNDSINLGYLFKTPGLSPQFFLVGPLKLFSNNLLGKEEVFKEVRMWQIANDAVASGIIIPWPGSTTLPTGWSRVAALDTYFIEGTTANPSSTAGGAANHTHTSPSHTHSTNHTHSGTISNSDTSQNLVSGTQGGSSQPESHTHTITTGDSTVTSSGNGAASLGTTSNNPTYTEVIWISSNGTNDIPNGAWAFFSSDTLPTNWTQQTGKNYLKGSTSGNPGGGTGGSNTHDHTDSGHTHTITNHTHSGTSDQSGSTGARSTTSGTAVTNVTHTHDLSGGSSAASLLTDNTATVGSTTGTDGEPPFYELNIIQNATGGDDIPDHVIALWTGTTATIPQNWELCNGAGTCPNLNDKFIKGTDGLGEVGTTGGATSHSHGTGNTHTHSSSSHTHSFTVSSPSTTTFLRTGTGTVQDDPTTDNHSGTWSPTSGSFTSGTATITADTSTTETRPPYKEAVYIMFHNPGRNISGYVKGTGGSDESSFIGNPPCNGSTAVLTLQINGSGSKTTSCDGTGYFVFSNVTYTAGDTVTIYLNGNSTPKGNLVMIAGAATITDAEFYQGRVVIRDDNNGSITNEELSDFDYDNDNANLLFTSNLSGTYNLTTMANSELHIWTGDTYLPGGTVTINSSSGTTHLDDSSVMTLGTANSDIKDVTIDTGATVNANTNTYLRGTLTATGTFTYSGTPTLTTRGTTSFTGAGTKSVYNLVVGDGTTSTTTLSATTTIANDITVGSGSAFNVNVDLSAPGNITTTGAINYTSGTPTLTMTGTGKTFGGGSGNVTLYKLSTSGSGTNTFSAGGTNTINNDLTVGTGTTLNIGSSISIGGSLINTTTGIINATSGTITMTNAASSTIGSGSGAITLSGLTTSGTGTHSFSGSGTNIINGSVSIGSGSTLNLNSNVSIAGNISNIGNLGYSGTPTVTMTGNSGSVGGGSGTVSFYGLTVNPAASPYTTTFNTNATVNGTLNIPASRIMSLASGVYLTHAGATLTLSGTISGSGTYVYQSASAFPTTGTLSANLRMDATNTNQTLTARTYGANVEVYNSSAVSTRTVTLGNNSNLITINGNLTLNTADIRSVLLTGNSNNPPVTIGGNFGFASGGGTEDLSTGTNTWTVSGNFDLTGGGSVTIQSGNTIKMNGTSKVITTASKTLSNFEVSGGSISNSGSLTTNGTFLVSGGTFTANSDVSIGSTLTVNNGTTFDGNQIITASGSVNGTGTINMSGGSFFLQGTGNFGDTTSWTFNDLTFSGTTTAIATSNITVNGTMSVVGSLAAGSKTYILKGTSTPLSVSGGTFTPDTSTVSYNSAANVPVIPTVNYYNLKIGDSTTLGADRIYTSESGTINIGNDLTIGAPSGSYYARFEVNTYDTTINVTGSVTITALGIYSAASQSTSPLTIANNFTNNRNAGFVHNNGKVVFNTTNTSTLLYSNPTTFYTLYVDTPNKTVRFDNVDQTSTTNIYLVGQDCSNMVSIDSDDGSSVFEISATGSKTVNYVNIKNSNAVTAITASNSTNGGNNSGSWTINTGECTPPTAPNIPSLDLPANDAQGINVNPALKTTGTDANNDYLRYEITICEDLGMSTSCVTYDQNSDNTPWSGQDTQSSTAYNSGTQATLNVPTALKFNQDYYWKSRAKDPGGSNVFGSTQATAYHFKTTNAVLPRIFGGSRFFGGVRIQ